MKITPLEIRQKTFEKKLRGYDKEEVDAFLMSLSQEWENMNSRNKELQFRVESLQKDVEKLREVESSLFKTLKTAEDTGSHMVEQAKKDAQLMLKEAHIDSEGLMNEARRHAKSMIEDAETIVKESLSGVRDQIKELENEYENIQNLKDTLLQELQHAANDTLERVQKIKAKGNKFQSIKVPSADELISNTNIDTSSFDEIKKVTLEETPVETAKEREVQFEINKDTPTEETPVEEETTPETPKQEEPKKDGGSFFDMID